METLSTTPIQKVTELKPRGRAEETRFMLHLPVDLFKKVREIGFKENKKKVMIVELIAKYIKKR